jgi:predicted transcriptional regulator
VPLTQQLRKAVLEAGVSRYRIAKETGVSESALAQFVNGHRGLSMDAMDAIGGFLRLVVVVEREPGSKKEA